MQNYKHKGEQIEVVLAAAAESGEVVSKGKLLGVAGLKGATSDNIAITVEGVFSFAKAAPAVFSQGDSVYYDDVAKLATDDSTKKFLGIATGDVLVADTAVDTYIGASGVMAEVVTKFNALLAKLDADGVGVSDYVATLEI